MLINAATFVILPARKCKFSICNRPRCAHLGKRRVHILPTPSSPTDKFQIVKDKTNNQKMYGGIRGADTRDYGSKMTTNSTRSHNSQPDLPPPHWESSLSQ